MIDQEFCQILTPSQMKWCKDYATIRFKIVFQCPQGPRVSIYRRFLHVVDTEITVWATNTASITYSALAMSWTVWILDLETFAPLLKQLQNMNKAAKALLQRTFRQDHWSFTFIVKKSKNNSIYCNIAQSFRNETQYLY